MPRLHHQTASHTLPLQQYTSKASLVRYLWLASLTFLITTGLCVLLEPTAVYSHAGISYYGNLRRTIMPYGIGLIVTAYFLVRASALLKAAAVRNLRYGLAGIALALLGIVITPSYAPFVIIPGVHVLFGMFIYVSAVILSLTNLIRVRGTAVDWALLTLQLTAVILAGLSFHAIGILSIMLPAQLLAMTTFGALLIRAAGHLSGYAATESPAALNKASKLSGG